MNSKKNLSGLGAAIAVLVLVVAGVGIAAWWVSHEQSQTKSTLASGYNTHSLFAPFMLESKSWQPSGGVFSSSGTWTYYYTAQVTPGVALAAAKKQLSDGGYQVVATSPDQITATRAILYRDLITGDDSLKVDLNLKTTPVTAVVTVSPLEGS